MRKCTARRFGSSNRSMRYSSRKSSPNNSLNFLVSRKLRNNGHSSSCRTQNPALALLPLSPELSKSGCFYEEFYRAWTISPRGAKVVAPKVDKSALSVGSYDFCPRNFCVFFGGNTAMGLSSLPTKVTRSLSFSCGTVKGVYSANIFGSACL